MGMAAFMRASFQIMRLLVRYLLKTCYSINKNFKLNHYNKNQGTNKSRIQIGKSQNGPHISKDPHVFLSTSHGTNVH